MDKENKIGKLNISFFKPLDLVFYVFTLLFVLFTLFAFIIMPKKENSTGFNVYENNNVIFTFYYNDKTFEIKSGYENKISVDLTSKTVEIKTGEDNSHFNVLSFDCENRTVCVKDSNCSMSKDCVYSPKISGKSGAIYCSPHNVKILPIGGGKIPPVTG